MTREEQYYELGALVSNFQSLEFIIRAYLYANSNEKELQLPKDLSVYEHPVGAELSENYMTNYDSLGSLIKKINIIFKQKGIGQIDISLVDIRDALAHGRIASLSIDGHSNLVKFGRPKEKKVVVTFNETMTYEWFEKNQNLVYDAIALVSNNLDQSIILK